MRKFLVFLFVLSSCIGYAQEPQSWLIYFGQSKFKDSKFSIHHEVQLRDHQLFGDHNQSLIRVGGQYQMTPKLQLTAGYAYIHSESAGSPNKPFGENRIYQEAVIAHGIHTHKMRHRFRVEERFIENQDFRGRLRYCLFYELPLTSQQFQKGGLYLAFYDEVFLNVGDTDAVDTFDRNRLYAGLGFKVKDNLGLQLGYMLQHVGKNKGSNHILLSTHHTINW